MSNLNIVAQGLCAIATIDGDAVTPTYIRQRGFTGAITRNGAGDYTLTLNEAWDFAGGAAVPIVTVLNNALAFASVEVVSATQLRVRMASATVVPAITAADLNFTILIAPVAV